MTGVQTCALPIYKAKEAGVAVIGYDRLIENTASVDAVVQFGSVRTGELQGQSLLEGLKELKGDGPYNIELFGGGPADLNAPNFFTGAMNVLQPKIDDGTLTVVSGQTDFTQAATPDWDNSKAQSRMDSLLSGFYADKKIDGVLSPNDGIAGSCDAPRRPDRDIEPEGRVPLRQRRRGDHRGELARYLSNGHSHRLCSRGGIPHLRLRKKLKLGRFRTESAVGGHFIFHRGFQGERDPSVGKRRQFFVQL